ncbi:MAG: transglutaminase-like domain-containing protein [Acidobacteriota bacterium]|nr:transglutaminase-like domain-containing protein [Acidobacteriota bacterium]
MNAALLPVLYLLLAPPGARVMVGKQQAYYQVTPKQASLVLSDYSNNGFSQDVRLKNGKWDIQIEVGNRRLGSRMRGKVVSGFPDALAKLEMRLNMAAPGFFADQVALIMDWLRTEIDYSQTAGGAQDVATVMKTRKANCVGYCNLALFILDKMGVEARYVTGVAFRREDATRRLLEGEVLHRWIEIRYDDAGWVFSDPAGKVNFVEATYLVLGIRGVHPLDQTLEAAVGAGVQLKRLKNGLRRVGTLNTLDQRLKVRPNRMMGFR